MLKFKILFVAVLIISCSILAQNLWTNEISLNFTVQSNTKVASFADANGIHIVYSRNGGIRYALVNSQGGVIKYDKLIESEGSGTDFANVVAIGSNVYAIYHKNNNIRVARSTNLGDSWNTSFSSRPLTNTDCNKIVAYKNGDDIHITWSERRPNSNYNDAHYVKFTPLNLNWTDYRRVSETETYGGENPDLALSSGKVHVNYTISMYNHPKDRDRNSDGNWNTPESIPFYNYPLNTAITDLKPMVVGNQLNTFYKASWSSMNNYGVYLSHSYKSVSGTTWTQNASSLETDKTGGIPYPHVAVNTVDGKIHFIFWDKNQSKYSYRTLIGTTFSSHIAEITLTTQSNSLVGIGNDLYLLRISNPDVPAAIAFRHYDAAPLAPTNPQLSSNPGNGLVKFTWTKNNEPDISLYEIWRKVHETGDIWQSIGTTTNTYFVDPDYYYAPGSGDFGLTYRVRAKDVGNNYSSYSSEVSTRGEHMGKKSVAANSQLDFNLRPNYPNPFNPSTTISYSIKEDGLVTLKVYDMLGNEVAELLNEQKEAGYYKLEFDASNLPSGVYIYKLQSGKFTAVNKMILMR
jgi:hypothetical protein